LKEEERERWLKNNKNEGNNNNNKNLGNKLFEQTMSIFHLWPGVQVRITQSIASN
jgi:hypothetical protein